ncbi:MAG: hypothetical protein ACYTEZ_08120 [Planctomycetota bacterium]
MRCLLLVCAVLPGMARAQEMDELSRELLEAWEKKEYRLARAGVKKCSFDIQAKFKGMTGAMESRGDYRWDGKKRRLRWERPVVGNQLAMQGWTEESFDADLVPDYWRTELRKCKLTARKEKDHTVVTVDGQNKPAWKQFVFDPKGTLARLVIDGRTPQGKIRKEIKFTWKKVGAHYLATEWTFDLRIAMSWLKGTAKVTYGKVGAYHVMTRYEETITRKGKPWSSVVLEFTGHRLK